MVQPRLATHFDPEVSHQLERLAARAWPADEVEEIEGWLLRRTVGVGRRRGDDDFRRARVEMELRLVALREDPGRLEHDVDAELTPRKRGRIALVQQLQLGPVHGDRAVAGLDLRNPGVKLPGFGRIGLPQQTATAAPTR